MQFRGSLYGLVDVLDMENKNTRTCYYFGFSEFFRYRDVLDGAILTAGYNLLQLCINNLSPRANEFRKSPLVEVFSEGVLDPTQLEKQNKAYIADCDVDRCDKAQVLAYLQSKYQKGWLIDINLAKHTASIAVPREQ